MKRWNKNSPRLWRVKNIFKIEKCASVRINTSKVKVIHGSPWIAAISK